MKELYTLSSNLGFIANRSSLWFNGDEYLWMCELQKWLREVYKIIVCIHYSNYTDIKFFSCIKDPNSKNLITSGYRDTYEESLEYTSS